MTAQERIKPGFKQTDIGLVPEGWDQKKFSDVLKIKRGQVDPRIKPYADMTLVAPDHIGEGSGRLIERSSAREQKAISGKYGFKPGDLVYSKIRPYLRKVVVADFDGLCSADMYPLTPLDGVDGRFCFYVMLDTRFTEFANSVSARSGIPKINREELAQFEFALPSIAEQRAIAASLSDADALIDSLDALIVKKRDLKQAAMQQLLTGKSRLPGFKSRWEVKRLGTDAALKARIGWHGLTTAEYLESGDYFLVTGTEFRNGKIHWDDCHYVDENRYEQDAHIQLRIADVLVTKDGTIGKVALVSELPKPATLNSGVFVVRPRNAAFDPTFFFYVMRSPVFFDFLVRLSAGSTINHLYQKDFVHFSFEAPPTLAEQTAIATILSDMDAELAAVEARRDKARAIKQGMTQELLTGRIRLV